MPNPNKKSFNYIFLGFLIPFVGMCITYLLISIFMEMAPSSHEGFQKVFSTLKSDAYHQYFPFFLDFRRKLLNGDNLLYAWNIGMGIDYIGLYAYYLGSPLNLLSVLIPEAWLLDFFTLLTPIRLGLAGMFFAIFLQKTFRKNDISIALFGSFYATCAWAFGYMWNTMWLDTFALLPLVVLGTVQLLRERKFILYTISLFFSVVINYYIGFFTCIFTLLVFICYEICRWNGFKRFLADLGLMALFTIIAIGATALITLPTYASLLATNAGNSIDLTSRSSLNLTGSTTVTTAPSNTVGSSFKLNLTKNDTADGFSSFKNWIALLEAMGKVATNCFAFSMPNSVADEGIPNIYCGIFASIFAFLFITCKQVKWRDRICGILMLLFLNASFVIQKLNYIWHGFHDTNMIPYRFSFIYSFVMLYLAYRTWLLRKKLKPWQLITAAVFLTISLFISQDFAEFINVFKGPISLGAFLEPPFYFPFVNLFFLFAYFLCLFCTVLRKPLDPGADHAQKRIWYQKLRFRRSLGAFGLVCVICLELFINFAFTGVTTDLLVDAADYPRGTPDILQVAEHMKAQDKDLFYRAETSHTHILNDSALIGYNGITTFTSSANASLTTYLKGLGYGALENWNRYVYEESSPVANMFLNLKYLIERNSLKENPYFTEVHRSGSVYLLENNYYLPLGFMIDSGMADFTFNANKERFAFQNEFLSAALGETVTPWSYITAENLEISASQGITVNNISKSKYGSCKFSSNDTKGYINFVYTIDQEGYFCTGYNLYPSKPIAGTFSPTIYAYIDHGDGFTEPPILIDTYSISYTLGISQVHPGDRVRICVECKPNWNDVTYNVWAAILDQSVVDQAYEKFSQSTLNITKFDETLVEGSIDCKEAGLLYTSIPQNNGNWHVYVDGKEACITLIGGVMVGVMLEEGPHTITFRYKNKAFQIGLIVSIVCVLVFIGICLLCFLSKKKAAKNNCLNTEDAVQIISEVSPDASDKSHLCTDTEDSQDTPQ